MQFGLKRGQNRIFFLILIISSMIFAGCSLASPSGGDDDPDTFEGPPTVRIFSPLANQTFLAGTTVNIQARVENAGSDVARVTIFLDDAVVGDAINPNTSGASAFSITQDWLTSVEGQYQISVIAERADGTASERETVTVSVIPQASVSGNTGNPTATTDTSTDSQTVNPTATTDTSSSTTTDTNTDSQPATAVPTNTPAPPTNTPEPEATSTPSVPMARVVSGANLRRGPSTIFEPPVGSIAANSEAEIIGVSPGRDWYKIQYGNGSAWIFANLVETTGNIAALPVDAGPPTPVPATNTPIPPPPTETPVPNPVNLIVAGIGIDPHPLKCQEASEITVTVTNNGTANAESGGKIRIEAVLVSTGAVLETTETIFGAIPAGGSVTASAFITVGTNFDELQRIRATVDTDNQVGESNESDNSSDVGTDYVLQKASC